MGCLLVAAFAGLFLITAAGGITLPIALLIFTGLTIFAVLVHVIVSGIEELANRAQNAAARRASLRPPKPAKPLKPEKVRTTSPVSHTVGKQVIGQAFQGNPVPALFIGAFFAIGVLQKTAAVMGSAIGSAIVAGSKKKR
jgi:hypothetical protein